MSQRRQPAPPPSPAALHLDAQLIRLSQGDTSALRIIYDLTYAKLFRVGLRILSDRQETEDVVQDTYIKVWKHAAFYRSADNGSPISWLICIVRNGALDKIRKRKFAELDADDGWAFDIIDPTACPFRQLQTKEEAVLLAKMLDGLSLQETAALRIAFYDDETYAVVSQRLGLPEGTVKSTIRRALERLRPEAEMLKHGDDMPFPLNTPRYAARRAVLWKAAVGA